MGSKQQKMPDESLPSIDARQVDITPLLGMWTNSNRATQWIKRFELAKKGEAFTMRAFGATEPADWGEVKITTYTDNNGEVAFHAVYGLERIQSLLAANTAKGIIVIAAYHSFTGEGGGSNYFLRDFYFQEQNPI